MKKLLMILLWTVAGSAYGQSPPANDLCINAIELPIENNCNWFSGDAKNCTPTTTTYLTDSLCFTWGANGKDIWFTFIAQEANSWMRFKTPVQGFGRQLFTGTCDTMKQVRCFPSINPGTIPDTIIMGPLQPGLKYYLRITNRQSTNLPSYPFEICLKRSGIRNYIQSKPTGGLWTNASTWVGNIVPTAQDSVEIVDGSTVTTAFTTQDLYVKWLKIGGSDTVQKAILKLRQSLILDQDLIVSRGDSILGILDNGGYISSIMSINTSGNIKLDGGIRVLKLGLYFLGTNPITVDGSGSFFNGRFYGFSNHSPGGVQFHFGGAIEYSLTLGKGIIHFHKPIVYNVRNPQLILFTKDNSINRYAGDFTGPLTFQFPPDFIAQKGVIDYQYQKPPGLVSPSSEDTVTRIGKEMVNTQGRRNLYFNRSSPENVLYFDSTSSFRLLNMRLGTIRMRNPADTFFAHYIYMGAGSDTDKGYMDQGNICLWLNPIYGEMPAVRPEGERVQMSRGGRCRSVSIHGPIWQTEGQKICIEVIPSPPTGQMNAPITNLGGHSVLQIKALRPIAAGQLTIQLFYNQSDNLLFNPLDLLIAQGPTPNGPWKKVSQPINMAASDKSRTSDPIDWADGYYFCWATTGQGMDMAAVEVLTPPKHFQTGCFDSPKQPVGVVIKNVAVASAESFMVGYQLGNGAIKSQFVSYPVSARLSPLQKDTIWFTDDQGQEITLSQKQTINAWVKQTGDVIGSNDTIKKEVDYRPMIFPYFINFDSISTSNIQFPVLNNIPYRWYDSILYKQMQAKGTGTPNTYFGNFRIGYTTASGSAPTNKNLQLQQISDLSREIYTNRIGPIQKPALIELKYRIGFPSSPPALTDMRPGDTLHVEGSEDCGYSWKSIFKVHRGNRHLDKNMVWLRDSLTFSNLSFVSLRFRQQKGNGVPSPITEIDSVKLYPGVLVSTSKPVVSNGFELFPNPNSGKLFVRFNAEWTSENISYSIVNVQGQVVQHGKLQGQELDISNLISNGLYWFSIQSNGKSDGQKIIIQR